MSQGLDENKLNLAEIVAIGVGGMVGGGIFATLGLAIETAGHATAIALAIGGLVALLTGYSYARLGLTFRGDGGSFTYIEQAFGKPTIAAVAGWLLVAGYVATLALYATTFGAYGAALAFGQDQHTVAAAVLGVLILTSFLAINLTGAKVSARAELMIVGTKLAMLGLFAIVGLLSLDRDRLFPIFDHGLGAPITASALIFVAYEGFELIPNAMEEMEKPESDLARGLLLSIAITMIVYIAVALVAVGHLTAPEVARDKEYVLAIAARPVLGKTGFILIGLAALLSTASAINATLFGSARLAMTMARDHALPRVFSLRERTRPVPWVSLLVLTGLTIAFQLLANLAVIAAFASATFLVIFALVNLSAFRLRSTIGINAAAPALGMTLSTVSLIVLLWQLWQNSRASLAWLCAVYFVAVALELILSRTRGMRRPQRVLSY